MDWQSENFVNDRGFHAGSELQDDFGFEHSYSTFYREYDPALGRFHAIDPMVDKYANCSPYSFAFNDPMGNEPYAGSGQANPNGYGPTPPIAPQNAYQDAYERYWADGILTSGEEYMLNAYKESMNPLEWSLYQDDVRIYQNQMRSYEYERARLAGGEYRDTKGNWQNVAVVKSNEGFLFASGGYEVIFTGAKGENFFDYSIKLTEEFFKSDLWGFLKKADPNGGEGADIGFKFAVSVYRGDSEGAKEQVVRASLHAISLLPWGKGTSYISQFFKANPAMKKFVGKFMVEIHHRIPQMYIKMGLFPEEMITSLSNLQALPRHI